jgi:DedD protein
MTGVSPRVVDLQPDQSSATTRPADSLERWVVQVGSFADSSNAKRIVSELKANGMSAFSETVTSSSSTLFRVRIGPFLEREEAVRTEQQLSKRLSINGVVMSAD